MELPLCQIRKLNGHIVEFEPQQDHSRHPSAGEASGEFRAEIAENLTLRVMILPSI